MLDIRSSVRQRSFLFVVGAPRSGTTWLHHMMMAHPKVVSLQAELTLFAGYLSPAERTFSNEKMHRDKGHWEQGLPLLFEPEEFDEGMRHVIDAVYGRLLLKNPDATHIVDKHPAYARHMPLIARLLPQSRFIHIIRDGREVVVSMMSAKRRIGFGEGEITGASKEWHGNLTAAREAGASLGPERYMEVRYEDLMANTTSELAKIFEHCRLEVSAEECLRISQDHAIDRKPLSRADPAHKELRKTPGAVWKNQLSVVEQWTMDRMVGRSLIDLGYGKPGWWAASAMDRPRMFFHPVVEKMRRSVRSVLHIWAKPVARRL